MLRIFDKSRGAFLPNQHFSDGMNKGRRGKITRLWGWGTWLDYERDWMGIVPSLFP